VSLSLSGMRSWRKSTVQDFSPQKNTMNRYRAHIFPWICVTYLILIYGLPSACVVELVKWSRPFEIWAGAAAPLLWVFVFTIVAGGLSIPHQSAVVPGKIRRDLNTQQYFHRRLYGLCWTAIFYNKPAYYLLLTIPSLKRLLFRIFGYRGCMKFTIYPDTWIRDLPILKFEEGAYVSNRATLGTNIVLSNNFLLVGGITLRAKALVGHLAMIAPGVVLDEKAEVGVGVAVGINSVIGAGAFVGPCCAIGHGTRIDRGAMIGAHSYVGSGSLVSEGVKVPEASMISSRTKVQARSREKGLASVRGLRTSMDESSIYFRGAAKESIYGQSGRSASSD
jgi:carbonic anhydrase/acetyltransferase-like protein (isoleucine patch superfamily)